ncbi:MAG: hypothetical protein ACOYUZ_01535 [Patescibacteria group bacterium]
MLREEWEARKGELRSEKNALERSHYGEILEYQQLTDRLAALLKAHGEVLRRYEELTELIKSPCPPGHVRCQAIHHGRLICDEIAERGNLPQGWTVSIVGDLYYCPAHGEHADVVNAPTIEAQTAHHRPQVVEELERRR